jgi:hypothetical protein
MGVYGNQRSPEVPPERKGYVLYVLDAAGQVPMGEPHAADDEDEDGNPFVASCRFHEKGDVVSVHAGFKQANTWRKYDPKET